MNRLHEVAIIGTGFAGIGMAVKLRAAGITDFVVLEQANGLGGTWRDNDYPGAACDVPSHLYSFSFEPCPAWSRSFAPQVEILAYLKHVATKHGVLPHVRFGFCVASAAWDARRRAWRIAAHDGTTVFARTLVAATGALSRPAPPDIPGLERFRGPAFHTAQWNHAAELDGKTVAVIGTGASAIQVVPALAPRVHALKVFQRTPPWILPKSERAISAFEAKLFTRFPVAQRWVRELLFWMFETRVLAFSFLPQLMWLPRLVASTYLKRRVLDVALREKLTPKYQVGCKRVLLSDDYFEAIQRANVEVIAGGIAEIRERSVLGSDGVDRMVDAIVLATGFQVGDLAAPPFEIRGCDDVSLSDVWSRGPEAYLGTSVAGFPNLFFILGPNSLLGHNSMVHMIEAHIRYITDCLQTMRVLDLDCVEVKRPIQERFNRWVQERMQRTIWATGGCTNRYQTSAGKHVAIWPASIVEFRRRTTRFDVENYVVQRRSSSKENTDVNLEERAFAP